MGDALNYSEIVSAVEDQFLSLSRRKLRYLSLFAVSWKTWLYRNSRVFRNKCVVAEEVADTIVWMVSMIRDKDFEGVPLPDLFILRMLVFKCQG